MANSVFISYEVGNNPTDYDEQFEFSAELELCEVFEGIKSLEQDTVYNQDFISEVKI